MKKVILSVGVALVQLMAVNAFAAGEVDAADSKAAPSPRLKSKLPALSARPLALTLPRPPRLLRTVMPPAAPTRLFLRPRPLPPKRRPPAPSARPPALKPPRPKRTVSDRHRAAPWRGPTRSLSRPVPAHRQQARSDPRPAVLPSDHPSRVPAAMDGFTAIGQHTSA